MQLHAPMLTSRVKIIESFEERSQIIYAVYTVVFPYVTSTS